MKTKYALMVLMVLLPLALLTFLSNGGSLSLDLPASGWSAAPSGQQEDREQEDQQATVDQQQETGSAEEQEKSDTDKEKCRGLMEEAEQLLNQSKYEEAIKKYEEAFELCQDPNALYSIAEIYDTELDQYKDALSYYERSVETITLLDNKNKDRARTRIDEIRGAIQAYETGNGLYKEGKYEEAIKYFQESDVQCPHAIHSMNIGRCYEKLAIESYQASIDYIDSKPAAKWPLTDAEEQNVKRRLETLKALPPLIQ